MTSRPSKERIARIRTDYEEPPERGTRWRKPEMVAIWDLLAELDAVTAERDEARQELAVLAAVMREEVSRPPPAEPVDAPGEGA